MTQQSSQHHQPLSIGRIVTYGIIAIVGSIVANLIVRAIGLAIINVSPAFDPLADMGATILFTSMLVFVAVIVFAVVDRKASDPVRTFNMIALIALALSLIPDVMMILSPSSFPFTGISFGAVVILMVQHVVAYAVTVYVLTVLAYRQ